MDETSQPEIQPKSSNKYGLVLGIVVVVVFLVLGGVWYSTNLNQPTEVAQTATTTTPVTSSSTVSSDAIQNDADLQSASADLDSSNVDSIDTSLTQNDTDSATF